MYLNRKKGKTRALRVGLNYESVLFSIEELNKFGKRR